MAENDNNNGRPVKASPGAKPETFSTNNVNGRVQSNYRDNSRSVNESSKTGSSKSNQSSKKGK